MATVAKIGPAHGVQIIPSESPTKNPVPKPSFENFFTLENFDKILLTKNSNFEPKEGIIRDNPKIPITKTAKNLKIPGSKWKIFIIYEIDKVIIVKLVTIPKTMPKGFFFPPDALEDKTIGRRGHMHGAKIETSPEINENKINVSMFSDTNTINPVDIEMDF